MSLMEFLELDGRLKVKVDGKWNLETSFGIGKDILYGVEKCGLNDVVLDFSELEYIDSTGISELIKLRSELRRGGGNISIVSAPDVIKKILSLTKIDGIISVV